MEPVVVPYRTHTHKGPELDVTLCGRHPEIITLFEQGVLCFNFLVILPNFIANPNKNDCRVRVSKSSGFEIRQAWIKFGSVPPWVSDNVLSGPECSCGHTTEL